MFNDENLVREPREVEGYFEARNNRETGILVGQYLKATPIEQRREAQEDGPEYENKERAEEITKRLLGANPERDPHRSETLGIGFRIARQVIPEYVRIRRQPG
jgi:hypothetical protein